MRSLFVLLFMLLTSFLVLSQEIVASEIEVSSTPSLSCISCSGELTIMLNQPGVKTFTWYDVNGNEIYSESTATNSSTQSNLCVGSYYVEVLYDLNSIESVWASISELGVDLNSPGEIHTCSSYESLELNDVITSEMTFGGYWEDPNGIQVSQVLTNDIIEGNYIYHVPNGSCINSAVYPINVNEPANSGDGTTYIICEDFEEFNLLEPMAGSPDVNGFWLNSQNQPVDPFFNPGEDEPELFTYNIDSVYGCPTSFSTLLIVENELPSAGEDGTLNVCQSLEETVDLFTYLNGSPETDGTWYDPQNIVFDGSFNSSSMGEGLYRYTVSGSVPCPADISYVSVDFIDNLETGDDITLEICSVEEEFNLNDILTDDFTPGGNWLDNEGGIISPVFNPSLGSSEVYTYELTGAGCVSLSTEVEIVNEVFHSAGGNTDTTLCEVQGDIDLFELLSNEASLVGTWFHSGQELNSSEISGLPQSETYTYVIPHAICSAESSVLQLTIDDNPSVPQLEEIFVCSSESEILLNDLANFQSTWEVQWVDVNSELVETTFDPQAGIDGEFELFVDAQNSCPPVSEIVNVYIESSVLEDENLYFEFCTADAAQNLNEIISEEIESSSFILNQPQIFNPADNPGLTSVSVIESGLNACVPPQINVTMEVHEWNVPGDNVILNECESDLVIDLNSFSGVSPGIWHYENVVLSALEIPYSSENNGVYVFTPDNHPICPEISQEITLDFEEPFIYEPLSEVHICLGESVVLSSPATDEGVSSSWQSAGSSFNQMDFLFLSDSFGVGQTQLTYSMFNDVCNLTDSLMVTVHDIPSIEIEGDQFYCYSDDISLTAISDFDVSYSWSFNGQFVSEDSEVDLNAENSGIMTLEGINDEGCSSAVQTELIVNPLPEIEIVTESMALCAPGQITLSQQQNDNVSYAYWDINGEVIGDFTAFLNIDAGDSLNVYLHAVSENGCSASDGADNYIVGLTQTMASFELSSNIVSDVSPNIEVLNESVNNSFSEWTLNDDIIGYDNGQWQLSIDDFSTNHQLCLYVNNADNCPDTMCQFIQVQPELTVYVPNAFTPDNDNLNEVFKPIIEGYSVKDYEFMIFDRWGELIFVTNDVDQGWNGNVNSGVYYASPGVYTYVLQIREDVSLTKELIKGSVVLIR